MPNASESSQIVPRGDVLKVERPQEWPEPPQPPTEPRIELNGPRSVSFRDRGQTFTYIFRRIEANDWKKFFEKIAIESSQSGKDRTQLIDFRTAGLALVDATLADVSGYQTRGDRPLSEIEGWKDRLPYGHKMKAAELLQDAQVSTSPRPWIIDPEADEVVLAAKWGGKGGMMLQFDGLVHRFTPPSAEDLRRFNRATSEARVVGGTRTGRTIYPSRYALLAELYDRLILSVEGYAVDGAPLSDPSLIRTCMDTFHKVAAVQDLFSAPADEEALEAA